MDYTKGLPGLPFARARRGVRQKALAKKLGVSQNHLSGVEAGKREASLSLAREASDFLCCTVDDLLKAPDKIAKPRIKEAES